MSVRAGLKTNNNSFANHNVFLGPAQLDSKNIGQYNPLITGRGIFLWTKMPQFMETLMPDQTIAFKNYTEKGFKSFDGISDMSMNFEEMGDGTPGNTFSIATMATDEFREFTMKVYELSGSPVSSYVEMWVRGIHDPVTQVTTYLGQIESGKFPEANPLYHTAEGIYMTFDPTMHEKGIEYAALITNIVPNRVPKSFRNTDKGTKGLVELDLGFNGYKYESPIINAKAKQLWEVIRKTMTTNSLNHQITL